MSEYGDREINEEQVGSGWIGSLKGGRGLIRYSGKPYDGLESSNIEVKTYVGERRHREKTTKPFLSRRECTSQRLLMFLTCANQEELLITASLSCSILVCVLKSSILLRRIPCMPQKTYRYLFVFPDSRDNHLHASFESPPPHEPFTCPSAS